MESPASIVFTVVLTMINNDNSAVLGTRLADLVEQNFGLQAAVIFQGGTAASVVDTVKMLPIYQAPMGMKITNLWAINMGELNETTSKPTPEE